MIDNLLGMLGGSNQAGQVAEKAGIPADQASSAFESAVPLLLGAITRNAQDPQGAEALNNALGKHDGAAVDQFQQGHMPDTNEGQKILGHVFGGQQQAAANAVSQRSGIDPQNAMQILTMAAPLIMGFLGRSKQQSGGMDITGILGGLLGSQMGGGGGGLGGILGSVLGGATQQQGGGLGGMLGSVLGGASQPQQQQQGGNMLDTLNRALDKDGDGSAIDDLMGMFGGKR